jgi:hypothetical protein
MNTHSPVSSTEPAQATLHLLRDRRWEGTIQNFSYAVETSCNQLLTLAITKLQCHKQTIDNVLHHFLQIQLRVIPCEDVGSDILYLRLGWGMDHCLGEMATSTNFVSNIPRRITCHVDHDPGCTGDE